MAFNIQDLGKKVKRAEPVLWILGMEAVLLVSLVTDWRLRVCMIGVTAGLLILFRMNKANGLTDKYFLSVAIPHFKSEYNKLFI